MNFEEILTSWQRAKARFTGMRLDVRCAAEFEYQGKQFGHPSTYAFVRFDCSPSDALTFEMRAEWPANLAADYCRLVEDAMRAAIVDALIASDPPHLGCAIACTDVKWDDVTSSEVAFHRATRAAMTALREQQKWSVLTRR